MTMARITKKPIPSDLAGWDKEVAGIRAFNRKLDVLTLQNGAKWAKSMREYYALRIEDLYNNPPPGVRIVRRGKSRTVVYQ